MHAIESFLWRHFEVFIFSPHTNPFHLMRHSLLLAFAFLVTFASACKKEDDEPSIPYVPPYRVSGLTDISIQKYAVGADPYEMYVQVEYENGDQERVTLSLEGIPDGLEDSMINTSGYPSFMSRIILVDSGVAEGTYTPRLVVTGERSGRREFPFNVRMLAVPDCSTPMLGNYTTTSFCNSGSYTMTIQAQPTTKNRVLLSNLNNNGTTLYGDADCSGTTGTTYINIPNQTVNGVTYYGSGSFRANPQPSQPTISLNVYRSGFGTCSYSLVR